MKRNFMILTVLAAALVMLPCCKKEKDTAAGENDARYTIKAKMESPSFDSGEKTHLGQTLSSETPVLWSTNDHIAVFGEESSYTCDLALTEGAGTSIGQFSGPNPPLPSSAYCAFYPYSPIVYALYDEDDYKYTVTFPLPSEQVYQPPMNGNPTMGEGMLPMIAYYTKGQEDFKMFTMMAVLKVDLKGIGTVGKLVLKDGNENAKLWGQAQVTVSSADARPSATIVGAAGDNTLTLNCPGGVALNENIATSFYFVVPEGTLGEFGKGFSVTVYNVNGKTNESCLIDKFNVWGNIMQRGFISTLTVNEKVIVPVEGALPGVFSVGPARRVYFSEGNLWCADSQSNLNFYFESNQFGFPDSYSTDHCGHFYWSKSRFVAYREDRDDPSFYVDDIFFTNASETEPNPQFAVIIDGRSEAGKWRVLSGGIDGEWNYLLHDRIMTYGKPRYTNHTGGIQIPSEGGPTYHGVFIYPDDYNEKEVGKEGAPGTWDDINSHGIVFLPAAGCREGNVISRSNMDGLYAASCTSHDYYSLLLFNEERIDPGHASLGEASSVRLVRNVDY